MFTILLCVAFHTWSCARGAAADRERKENKQCVIET